MCHLKRHVKCDEKRPACLNCVKWQGYCDSYADAQTLTSLHIIHAKKAARILTEPPVSAIPFASPDQRTYFDEWSSLSTTFLSGGLGQTSLWTATMPQLTLQEKTLRYGAMAVGALRKAYEVDGPGVTLTSSNRHYFNAVKYYCEALRRQSEERPGETRPSGGGLRTALLSSLLFICFEAQCGNMAAALKHVTHGFSMLNELATCTDKAPGLVSIAPAPPALVQEILDCYKPLELQSRSFMGSYKRFFFSSPQPTPPLSAYGDASRPHPPRKPRQDPTQPPAAVSCFQLSQTGLPSPQSQDSPGSPATGQSPPRPLGILPFTKHTPYFRPTLSRITSLDDMPLVFRDMDETLGYWALVQRGMVQHIPMLTGITSRLALTRADNEAELEMKLASVKQNPRMCSFIADSRYWLQRWTEAYEPLFQAMASNSAKDLRGYLQAINLRVEYLILYVYTTTPRFSGIGTAKCLTPQYREINRFAETLLAARPNCGFAMDSGWTWPLFVSAFACRDPAVRADATRILGQYPMRNALRDSRVFRAVALKNEEVETSVALEGDEEAQWLRLRRREVVFEDFGTSIIYRSSQKNPLTGRWELVEEAAGFGLRPDGKLDWKRVPISDSASILFGVC
ncbi:fungal zn(2)-Cys(6) binuclear cluster domain-containing protein [Hirsutella rhossiliensis]|uniref:Fungal zn(2)-Cys(6) binuclear cluster domain-containing protein n=1 Tax=Hirsutella rhossiliensis TaxID=111463 RepID=A0A9P8SEJ6_9HYPO|nr:fungal zn(2)-Cys(6) binuclear cluster domain-containing protein [Hirsutella rhossiliensis]KAH0959059.1 fungal zn(2)-Cys(6) binuclear cluster domain-containing protein [Hirsutella rhossiliensis]